MASNAGANFRLSDEQYQTMSSWFTKYERDGDGQLDSKELRDLVAGVTGITADEELDRRTTKLMEKLDNDGSKTLAFNEFIRGYERMLKAAASNDSNGSLEDSDLLNVTNSKKTSSNSSSKDETPSKAPETSEKSPDFEELQKTIKKLTEEKEKLLNLNNILMKRIKDTASKSFEGEIVNQSQENSRLSEENSNLKKQLEELRENSEKTLKELESLKSNSNSSDTISYTFRWPYGGSNPSVGGQWNEWKNESMQKDEQTGEYFLKVDGLKPNTRYLYKYHVGGQWKEDLTAPTDDSEQVNGRNVINNILVTDSAEKDVRISNLERERDQLFRRNRTLEEEKKNVRPFDEKLEEKAKQLENELKSFKENNSKELEDLRREKEEQNAKNNEEKQKLEKELNDLKNSLQNSQNSEEKSKKLEENLRTALKNLEESNTKYAKLEEEWKNASKNSEENSKHLSALNQELKNSQEKVSKLEEELRNSSKNSQESSQLSQENAKLAQELKNSQEKSANLEEELKKASGNSQENSQLAQELKNSQEKVAKLEEELKNSTRASQESSQLSQENSQLAQELKESREKSAKLEEELKNASSSSQENPQTAQQLKESQEKSARLEEELKKALEELENSKQSLENAEHHPKPTVHNDWECPHRIPMEKLHTTLSEKNEDLELSKLEIEETKEKLQKAQQQVKEITADFEKKLKEARELEQKAIDQLTKVSEEEKNKVKEIEEKSKENVETLLKREKEAREEVAAAEQRLATLKADAAPILNYLVQAQIALRSNLNTVKAYQKTSIQGDIQQVSDNYKLGQQLTEKISLAKELQRHLNLLPPDLVEKLRLAELNQKDLELREANQNINPQNLTMISLSLTVPAIVAAAYVFLRRRWN